MTKTVLIVDGQAISRRLLRFALELQGYRVVEAGDVFSAVDALAKINPSLLVACVDSPDAGSWKLALEIRRRQQPANLPILFHGESQYREVLNAGMIGNCAWLDKPYRMGDLHSLVEALLDRPLLPGNSTAHRCQVPVAFRRENA